MSNIFTIIVDLLIYGLKNYLEWKINGIITNIDDFTVVEPIHRSCSRFSYVTKKKSCLSSKFAFLAILNNRFDCSLNIIIGFSAF